MAPPLTNPLRKGPFTRSKERGAYYTSETVANFLVRWAIRLGTDKVLDPSFGGGVFLRAASERLRSLGGKPRSQIFGIELDDEAHEKTSSELQSHVAMENLRARDFFEIESSPQNRVDVVVGNPPYIRYQRFTSDVRARALLRAAEQGIKLTKLSSSWAPFVIHSVSMLKREGRLAMVLPAELGYAKYATPVLEFLIGSFCSVTLITFKKKLFPEISEDTVLLLAEGKGGCTRTIQHIDLEHEVSLSNVGLDKRYAIRDTQQILAKPIIDRSDRLIEYLLPRKTRGLYRRLKGSDRVVRLGDLADVGIGYVTGANDFFHLSPKEVDWFGIPDRFLRNAVKRSKAFHGLEFTIHDWDSALTSGESAYLLCIDPKAILPKRLSDYIREGETKGVADAYKCRSRNPWYSVPHVYKPDGFLSYMSSEFPSLVANPAGAVAPNTLHILRLHPGCTFTSSEIAVSWPTSLTRLSVEVEGHSLGGGMLKLEPTEAENCLVAFPNGNGFPRGLAGEMDALMRAGKVEQATSIADQYLLRDFLGLDNRDVKLLSDGAKLLMDRRTTRSGRA